MDGVPELPAKLMRDVSLAARLIRSAKSVRVISHIDADGITAGSIAMETLKRLGIPYVMCFEPKITDETIEMVRTSEEDVVWICDLGGAYMSHFGREGLVVTDHHVPDPKWRKGQSLLDSFSSQYQLNPHLYGVDGSYEVCGAGMTYLLSRTISSDNVDLAYLAVVGAVGDIQDDREGKLVSWNRIFLEDAIAAGDVSIDTGIRFYGREARTLVQFLEYSEDPRIPGISGEKAECIALLDMLGIPIYAGGKSRTWFDLSPEEKEILTNSLRRGAGDEGSRLTGEIYVVNRYLPKSGIHDVKEFSTVLNSCGRYDDAETGARLCMGDVKALEDAERNRKEHRKNISVALSMIKESHLMRRRSVLQYFDAGDAIRDTVVGIVAGMILNSPEADPKLPIFAFARADDGIKVSGRATRELIQAGLDLSMVMHDAAAAVGGLGGGHSVAAGATIPEGSIENFLDAAEKIVAAQLGGRS